jgi:tetratricopeptide (TPR) repeat protein
VGFIFTDEPPEFINYPLLLEFRYFTIPAGEDDYRLALEFESPVDLEVLSIYPHAHYLGREMRIWATLPDGEVQWLLRIDDWDFNWQDDYRYLEPVLLPAGTTIHMEYSWDNSAANVRNPNQPPVPVRYGGRSSDEMGTVTLQVSPGTKADLATLEEAIARHSLARWPGDWNAHRRLGFLLSARGDYEGAIRHFRKVVERRPDRRSAHYNLGRFYQLAGQLGPAAKHYRRALELDPDDFNSLNNLGVVAGARGQNRRATRLFRRALEIEPEFEKAQRNLATALALDGRTRAGN